MLNSIRRYQQHRIFEMVLHNINLHLYISSVITLIVLLFNTFKIAVAIFFVCISISFVYNVFLYRRRKGNYYEAAICLDRELNGQDMFITVLENSNSSENLMLKLLHDRAEKVSTKILNQDFEKEEKQSLKKTLFRFIIVFFGFTLLYLILNSFNSKLLDKNLTGQNSATKPPNLSQRTNTEQSIKTSKKSNLGDLKSKTKGMDSTLTQDNSEANYKLTDSKIKKNRNQDSDSEKNQLSNSEAGFKQNKQNVSTENSQNKISHQAGMKKSKDKDHSSKSKAEISKKAQLKRNSENIEKKSIPKNNSLKNNPLKNSRQDLAHNINNSRAKADLDSRKSGNFGGQKLVETIKFKDQRDIRNTLYKKQKDDLEQVLSNPRMPKSYKSILKRFYSSEKK